MALLAIPNIARDSRQHPAQRRGHSRRDDGEARCRRAAGLGARRESGRVRRDQNAGRDAHDRLLRALRRPAARSEGMGDAAVHPDAARQAQSKQDGTVIPLPAAGTPFDPESRLYARGAADDKAPIVAMMTALDAIRAAGLAHEIEHQVRVRRRGGGRLAEPREDPGGEQGAVRRRRLADVRRRRSIRRRRQSIISARAAVSASTSRSTARERAAQRPLRQLGAESGDAAGAAARVDEGRRRPRARSTHFYDGVEPLSDAEKRAIAEAPDIDAELMHEFWLGATEGGAARRSPS